MGKQRRAHLRAASAEDTLSQARSLCAARPTPFTKDAALLEQGTLLFELRISLYEVAKEERPAALSVERTLSVNLHRRLKLSSDKLHFIKKVRELRLNKMEAEILLLLTLSELGMIDRVSETHKVQRVMCRKGTEALRIAQALHEEGKLVSSGLVTVNVDEIMDTSTIEIAPDFIASFLRKRSSESGPWMARTYQRLLDNTYLLVKLAYDRANKVDERRGGNYRSRTLSSSKFDRVSSSINYYTASLWRKLERHPRWPLNALRVADLEREEKLIVLVLIGKQRNFFRFREGDIKEES